MLLMFLSFFAAFSHFLSLSRWWFRCHFDYAIFRFLRCFSDLIFFLFSSWLLLSYYTLWLRLEMFTRFHYAFITLMLMPRYCIIAADAAFFVYAQSFRHCCYAMLMADSASIISLSLISFAFIAADAITLIFFRLLIHCFRHFRFLMLSFDLFLDISLMPLSFFDAITLMSIAFFRHCHALDVLIAALRWCAICLIFTRWLSFSIFSCFSISITPPLRWQPCLRHYALRFFFAFAMSFRLFTALLLPPHDIDWFSLMPLFSMLIYFMLLMPLTLIIFAFAVFMMLMLTLPRCFIADVSFCDVYADWFLFFCCHFSSLSLSPLYFRFFDVSLNISSSLMMPLIDFSSLRFLHAADIIHHFFAADIYAISRRCLFFFRYYAYAFSMFRDAAFTLSLRRFLIDFFDAVYYAMIFIMLIIDWCRCCFRHFHFMLMMMLIISFHFAITLSPPRQAADAFDVSLSLMLLLSPHSLIFATLPFISPLPFHYCFHWFSSLIVVMPLPISCCWLLLMISFQRHAIYFMPPLLLPLLFSPLWLIAARHWWFSFFIIDYFRHADAFSLMPAWLFLFDYADYLPLIRHDDFSFFAMIISLMPRAMPRCHFDDIFTPFSLSFSFSAALLITLFLIDICYFFIYVDMLYFHLLLPRLFTLHVAIYFDWLLSLFDASHYFLPRHFIAAAIYADITIIVWCHQLRAITCLIFSLIDFSSSPWLLAFMLLFFIDFHFWYCCRWWFDISMLCHWWFSPLFRHAFAAAATRWFWFLPFHFYLIISLMPMISPHFVSLPLMLLLIAAFCHALFAMLPLRCWLFHWFSLLLTPIYFFDYFRFCHWFLSADFDWFYCLDATYARDAHHTGFLFWLMPRLRHGCFTLRHGTWRYRHRALIDFFAASLFAMHADHVAWCFFFASILIFTPLLSFSLISSFSLRLLTLRLFSDSGHMLSFHYVDAISCLLRAVYLRHWCCLQIDIYAARCCCLRWFTPILRFDFAAHYHADASADGHAAYDIFIADAWFSLSLPLDFHFRRCHFHAITMLLISLRCHAMLLYYAIHGLLIIDYFAIYYCHADADDMPLSLSLLSDLRCHCCYADLRFLFTFRAAAADYFRHWFRFAAHMPLIRFDATLMPLTPYWYFFIIRRHWYYLLLFIVEWHWLFSFLLLPLATFLSTLSFVMFTLFISFFATLSSYFSSFILMPLRWRDTPCLPA